MNCISIKKENECEIINIFDYKKKNKTENTKPHTGGATKGGANALKSIEDIQKLKDFFLNYNKTNDTSVGYRNYALVVFALNCGRRAGDILGICIGDIMNEDYTIKEYFYINEEKTKKVARIYINKNMRDAIVLYLDNNRKNLEMDQPLFISRQRDKEGKWKPLDIRTYNYWLKEAKNYLNLEGKISTHTCRKTMGRMMIDLSHPDDRQNVLIKLQQMYNHDSQATTLKYLDITDDEIDRLHDRIQL